MNLCVDLFCGLGGWAEGFRSEGYDVIGFDVERHDYGTGGYPGHLALQDALTLHGSQFKNAVCIVASPPCQEFSYMAMPWKRAKQIAGALRGEYDRDGKVEFPEGYTGSRTIAQLTALFDACFRIQREASAAAGRYIPMVVENVKGAQPWVGRANASFGSFYLWGDVRSIGGRIVAAHQVQFGAATVKAGRAQKFNPDGTAHGTGSWFAVADSKNRGSSKNGHVGGGSWFAIGSPGQTNVGQNPDGRKVPNMNFHDYEKTGRPGRSFQSAAVEIYDTNREIHRGAGSTCEPTGDSQLAPVLRGMGEAKSDIAGAGNSYGGGFGWDGSAMRTGNSKSSARKAASAQIAKIPFDLAAHIARCFKPVGVDISSFDSVQWNRFWTIALGPNRSGGVA